jgi:hypothetical protein
MSEDLLVPLPLDANTEETVQKDIEMSEPQEQKEEEIVVESVEESGDLVVEEIIVEEEVEEGGGIIEPPAPQPQTQTQTQTVSETKTEEKVQNDSRPRCHQITTDPNKPKYLRIHEMKEWTNNEVVQWLGNRFGLWGQQYIPAVTNKKMNGSHLAQLTKDQIKTELKVSKPIHLERIYRDICDARRPVQHLVRLLSETRIDGGTAASKMMRFGYDELYEYASNIDELKNYATILKERRISGRILLECTDTQLQSAMKDDNITLIEVQQIMIVINKIKQEEKCAENEIIITEINRIWNQRCNLSETRFKLLPQHLRDYSRPAPTYNPPPNYNINTAYNANIVRQTSSQYSPQRIRQQQSEKQQRMDNRPRITPLYEKKNVMQWNTLDCIAWLGELESKIDLKARYTPYFTQIKIDGPTLLNMTPVTLQNICCITTKTHLKQIVKAIDKIRDYVVFNGFGQKAHVKAFTQHYGGGYIVPRYQKQQQQQQQPIDITKEEETKPNKPRAKRNKTETQQQSKSDDESTAACFVCGATGNVMRCSQCKQQFYCSRDHQVEDWARHSKECQKTN